VEAVVAVAIIDRQACDNDFESDTNRNSAKGIDPLFIRLNVQSVEQFQRP